MQSEVISVIVPVFNIEEYLPKCLESIAGQTYRNLEIILVDDGSVDSSGHICDEFASRDPRAKVIHQRNRGLWAARNAGQDAASGEYLFFPDGDDYFHCDMIRILYEAINSGSSFDLAIAREKTVWDDNENTSETISLKTESLTRESLIRGLLAQRDDCFFVFMWNKLYRRSLIQDIRTNDYSRSQDFDFNIRAFLLANNAILVYNDLYYWRQHQRSLTKAPDAVKKMYSCRTRILYQNYLELSGENMAFCPAFLSRLYKTMALWKGFSVNSDSQESVFRDCREYERSTWRDYLFGEGNGIFEKIGCLLLIHTPHLTRFLMRITNNL